MGVYLFSFDILQTGTLACVFHKKQAPASFHCHRFSYLKGSVGETVICKMLKNYHCNYMFSPDPNKILGFILYLKDIWWLCQISFFFSFEEILEAFWTEQKHEDVHHRI